MKRIVLLQKVTNKESEMRDFMNTEMKIQIQYKARNYFCSMKMVLLVCYDPVLSYRHIFCKMSSAIKRTQSYLKLKHIHLHKKWNVNISLWFHTSHPQVMKYAILKGNSEKHTETNASPPRLIFGTNTSRVDLEGVLWPCQHSGFQLLYSEISWINLTILVSQIR
jgi:hypothetical protein